VTSFAELGVPTALTDVLERDGKTAAFPIQENTLPDTLAGRDVLGRGKTGSGKTLAFSLPIAARLANRTGRARPGHPRALVLAPTRELATQIEAVIKPLAAAFDLTTTTIYGGVSQQRQEQAMRRGVDIVVACPGRLEDLMKQNIMSLDSVQITVLDEADHMADLGFLPGVTRIMAATPRNGQRLLFSATLDNGVNKIVDRFLSNPIVHSVDSADSHVDAMSHHVFHVADAGAKKDLVRTLASGMGRRVLFTRTKHQAKKLAIALTADGIPAVDLHGNLSQGARDRNLAAFAGGGARVLVATDVAARGVHVDGIELVVHVDPPMEHKAYLHRSGRTARAGSSGDVVTVVMPEQRRDTDQLLRKANIQVRPQAVSAASSPVKELVGDVAPYVKPEPKAAPQPQNSRGARSGGRPQRSGGQSRNANQSRGAGQPRSSGQSRGNTQQRGASEQGAGSQGAGSQQRATSQQRGTDQARGTSQQRGASQHRNDVQGHGSSRRGGQSQPGRRGAARTQRAR